ncbi:hypothetical protein K469DRAFT_691225 [Zopfia rhizophila CBS 207.26]|uniref:Transcription factor domain-containing protein n=1 Tax=Zopfia rhizophila CBS 207.26 TaxID=1314779 RepID=A0A6A6ERQ3_9PEZI|nr:hypothetical protein K469DRAFT_691225 [Zopfia rhizophila CBS 207.26]
MLRPQWMHFTLWSCVLRFLSDNHTTIERTTQKYFATVHMWLPIISQSRLQRANQKFDDLEPSPGFSLRILAMHLLITSLSEYPTTPNSEESQWYRACKHHFGQHVALAESSIDLVQTGIPIALFEHTQCIHNRAHMTIGICARVTYTLKMDDVVAQQSNRALGEMNLKVKAMILTWWGLILLDRYINLPPMEVPEHPAVQQKPLQVSILQNDPLSASL